MPYKYEKFEKPSDAVKALEDGETIYLLNKSHKEYYPIHQYEDLNQSKQYYRRIEVKPFECWAIFWKDGGFVGVVECENPPRVLSGQRAARLREIIE